MIPPNSTLFSADEVVYLEARRHWLVIAWEAGTFFLLAIGPIVGFLLLAILAPSAVAFIVQEALLVPLIFFLTAWLFLMWIAFMVVWTNYYLDVLIITNKQLIDIEQFTLFARDKITVPLNTIQDMRIEILGILPTLLGFGNLYVETAGSGQEIAIRNIRNPEAVKHLINQIYHGSPTVT